MGKGKGNMQESRRSRTGRHVERGWRKWGRRAERDFYHFLGREESGGVQGRRGRVRKGEGKGDAEKKRNGGRWEESWGREGGMGEEEGEEEREVERKLSRTR
jgi:hypothetical protein